MKPFIKLAVFAVAVGMLAVTAGCAHKSPQERAEWAVKHVSEDLKLNDAQLVKLNALKDQLLTMRGDYVKRRSETQKAIGELLSQPTLNQAQALALIKNRTQEVNDKAPQIVSAFAGFYDSLTPEQQKKLHDEITESIERHQRYWGDE